MADSWYIQWSEVDWSTQIHHSLSTSHMSLDHHIQRSRGTRQQRRGGWTNETSRDQSLTVTLTVDEIESSHQSINQSIEDEREEREKEKGEMNEGERMEEGKRKRRR